MAGLADASGRRGAWQRRAGERGVGGLAGRRSVVTDRANLHPDQWIRSCGSSGAGQSRCAAAGGAAGVESATGCSCVGAGRSSARCLLPAGLRSGRRRTSGHQPRLAPALTHISVPVAHASTAASSAAVVRHTRIDIGRAGHASGAAPAGSRRERSRHASRDSGRP